MGKYPPKNNALPMIVGFIVSVAFIITNELFQIYLGIGIPRYIAIPSLLILGIVLLVKLNPREKNADNEQS